MAPLPCFADPFGSRWDLIDLAARQTTHMDKILVLTDLHLRGAGSHHRV
jgi:hypothetical protein